MQNIKQTCSTFVLSRNNDAIRFNGQVQKPKIEPINTGRLNNQTRSTLKKFQEAFVKYGPRNNQENNSYE